MRICITIGSKMHASQCYLHALLLAACHLVLCYLPLSTADSGLHDYAKIFLESPVSYLNHRAFHRAPFPRAQHGVKQFTPYTPDDIIKNLSSIVDWSTNHMTLELAACS
jgi:hypothetical protein